VEGTVEKVEKPPCCWPLSNLTSQLQIGSGGVAQVADWKNLESVKHSAKEALVNPLSAQFQQLPDTLANSRPKEDRPLQTLDSQFFHMLHRAETGTELQKFPQATETSIRLHIHVHIIIIGHGISGGT
jgi:hypothetical protein